MFDKQRILKNLEENPNDLDLRLIFSDILEEEGEIEEAQFQRDLIEFIKFQESKLKYNLKVLIIKETDEDYILVKKGNETLGFLVKISKKDKIAYISVNLPQKRIVLGDVSYKFPVSYGQMFCEKYFMKEILPNL